MPNSIDALLEVTEVVKEVTLVLNVFLNDASAVQDQFHCMPSSASSSENTSSTFDFIRLTTMSNITLLGWLIQLHGAVVLGFRHKMRLPFL